MIESPVLLYSCFIADLRVFFGVFLGPIFAILVFNTVVFVLVIRVLLKHSRKKIGSKDGKKYKATFKTLISIASVMLMFGLSWIFGAFTISTASIAFQWLFVIFNAFQGFFLFIFFCIIGQDAREEWIRFLTCGKYTKVKIVGYGTTSHTGERRESGAFSRQRATGSTYMSSHARSNTMLRSTGLSATFASESTDGKDFTLSRVENDVESAAKLTSIAEDEETVFANGYVDLSQSGSTSKLVFEEESKEDLQASEPEEDTQVRNYCYHNNLSIFCCIKYLNSQSGLCKVFF